MNLKKVNFSLIATVVIIIGFFLGLIIWNAYLYKRATFIAQTRIQFLEYESALKAYCLEYGTMPPFFYPEDPIWLNVEGNSELLIKALTGKNPDGSPLSNKDRTFLNPLGKSFCTLSNNNFFRTKQKSIDRSQLADAFNNTKICIIVEDSMDNDVVIPKSCFPKTIHNHIPKETVKKQIAIFSISSNSKIVVCNWDHK